MEIVSKEIREKVDAGKRLTKFDMAFELDRSLPCSLYVVFIEHYKRDDLVEKFNNVFNTSIK